MRIIRRFTKIHERGDTIVEVLIAISIISVILAGAYVTSNNSLLSTEDSQEHDDALQLAEDQLEDLQGIVQSNPNAIFGSPAPPNPFCISNVTSISAASSPSCTMNDQGGAVTTGQVKYAVSTSIASTDPNQFTVKVSWAGAIDIDSNQDSVQLTYRLYP